MSRPADQITQVYERHAEAWVRARLLEVGFYERGWFERFFALIPPGASVLDLGCGCGEPIARELSARGYTVTGVDASAAMFALFRSRLPGLEALNLDMRGLNLGQSFGGIIAWDSFFHLDPEAQRRMFPVFRAHAAPHAALMFTSGPAFGEVIGQLEGDPLYHASLDPSEYRDRLDEQGFELVAHVAEDPDCGGRTVWLARLR